MRSGPGGASAKGLRHWNKPKGWNAAGFVGRARWSARDAPVPLYARSVRHLRHRERPARGPAADAGVRPTDSAVGLEMAYLGGIRPAGRRHAACYIEVMPGGYLPILIFLAVAMAFPVVAILAAKLLRPSAPSVTKLEAYECGIRAASDSRGRYTVRFYIVAILFVIFDVETIFLYPWAVRYGSLGWFGVAEVAVFLMILVVGYIWAYKKGALEWV